MTVEEWSGRAASPAPRRVLWTLAVAMGSAVACLLAPLALNAPSADASPYIHAHRGGTLKTERGKQRPLYPEASRAAYRDAARRGFVLEMDTRLTKDGRAVLMHDPDLDRTTDCAGPVSAMTLGKLRRRCRIDLLGTEGNSRRLRPRDKRRARVPTLAGIVRMARRAGARINVEINDYPGEPGYDAGAAEAHAREVMRVLRAQRFPPDRLIVQSFLPANLQPFLDSGHFDSSETALLTLAGLNEIGPQVADGIGADYVSPQWPVSRATIRDAHDRGLRVVPFTLNRAGQVRSATRRGVDAVISDDPRRARRAARAASPRPPRIPPPPSHKACRASRASNVAPPIHSFHRGKGSIRVFALQYKQELANVVSYRSFRTKIECMIRRYVKPRLSKRHPNLVALTEDVGLMTLATGSRGAPTRELFADPGAIPGCENVPPPCGVAVAIGTLSAAYREQEEAYADRFGELPAFAKTFVAGTDTFARGWMQAFSDLARRYGVYILGSNNQTAFRESLDGEEIATFADPDVKRPRSAFVATSPEVYNEAFLWAPRNLTRDGPPMLRNVAAANKKVPLTPIEQLIQLTPGPSHGPDAVENVRPYRIPGSRARIAFATSLPAFVYGTAFGEPMPEGENPCADTATHYMHCLERLGANVVMQDEANPGRWATPPGSWQPLGWMGSTWRAVADPAVSFDYNVTPHMVGNLADLVFDGQTAITQRGLRGPRRGKHAGRRCHYVGNARLQTGPPENDPAGERVYAGGKREFLGLAPWVAPDGPRERLRRIGSALAPGSGKARENDYLETAVIADLTFPPDPRRVNCLRR